MRDHELELIAALVEGRLDDETEARALIASTPEHRDEYVAQKLAHEALRGAEAVELSEAERSALHRDVWTALRAGPGTEKTKTPWYYRWVPVAAGLVLVLVGLVTVVGQVRQQSGDFAETAGGLSQSDTTIAADSADDEGSDGDGASGGEADGAQTTVAAAEEPMAESLPDETVALYEREADLLRQGVFGDRLRAYDSANPDIEDCVAAAGLGGHRVLATLSPPTGDTGASQEPARVAVVFPEGAQLEDAPISFVDLDTCDVVYTDE